MEILGLVETLRGQGTFVCQNDQIVEETKSEMLTNLVDDFVRSVQALGLSQEAILEVLKRRFADLEKRDEVKDQ